MSRRLYVPILVDYFDDLALVAAVEKSPWCEVLWVRMLAEVKHQETDGVVTVAIAAKLRVPHWRKWIAVLADVGLVQVDDDRWVVASWLKHNLPSVEIEKRRQASAGRTAKSRGGSPPKPDGNTPRNALHGVLQDTETEESTALPLSSEAVKKQLFTSTTPTVLPSAGSEEEQTSNQELPRTVLAAVASLATSEFEAMDQVAKQRVGNRQAWLRTVQERITTEHGTALTAAFTRLQTHRDNDLAASLIDLRIIEARDVVQEWRRHTDVQARTPGARSWGASRWDIPAVEVEAHARTQWPDMPELVNAAMQGHTDATEAA